VRHECGLPTSFVLPLSTPARPFATAFVQSSRKKPYPVRICGWLHLCVSVQTSRSGRRGQKQGRHRRGECGLVAAASLCRVSSCRVRLLSLILLVRCNEYQFNSTEVRHLVTSHTQPCSRVIHRTLCRLILSIFMEAIVMSSFHSDYVHSLRLPEGFTQVSNGQGNNPHPIVGYDDKKATAQRFFDIVPPNLVECA
jgi:hypothetical protein